MSLFLDRYDVDLGQKRRVTTPQKKREREGERGPASSVTIK